MSQIWKDDNELFAIARRELFPAVVGDCMDKMKLLHQFLPPRIQPLSRNTVVVGRAMTVLSEDLLEESGTIERPFGFMLEALDGLQPGEVYVSAGGSPNYALWGELMSIRAMRCGAAGAVMDGYARDTHGILEMGFPVFSLGSYAQDQGPRGRVVDMRIPIRLGDVLIEPGDIVFGDVDGVCVIPRAAEVEVFNAAFEKARGEKAVRKALENGMTASAAFEHFGIL